MWDTVIMHRYLSIAAITCLALSAIADCAWAQASRMMTIEDQPGHVPGPNEEQLPAAFMRQAVFYRTNEPVGTIVVDTADNRTC